MEFVIPRKYKFIFGRDVGNDLTWEVQITKWGLVKQLPPFMGISTFIISANQTKF